jgi:hypothetical protein
LAGAQRNAPLARTSHAPPGIPRGTLIGAGVLALLAVVLPPRFTAALLAGNAEAVHVARVYAGVWVFKALLLCHGIGWIVLARWTRTPPRIRPLIAQPQTPPSARPLVLFVLLGIAAVLRLVNLDAGLWYDEITTLVEQVRAPLGDILSRFATQNQHPVYSLLARGTFALFGESETTLRLPAALLGVGSLAALYAFAVRVTTRGEALLATALLTVSYHHVWFSQNARGYTGLMLFALAGTALLADLLRQNEWPGWRPYVVYAAVMALGVYTHLTAAFVIIAHAAIVFVLLARARRQNGQWTNLPLVVALVLAGTLSLQLYAFMLPQMPDTLFFRESPILSAAWKSPFWLFAEAARGLQAGVPGGWPVIIAAMAVAGAGFVSYARQNMALATAMVLPPLLMAAVLIASNHNLWPRFFFFAAGFAVLIAVRGVFALAAPFGNRANAVAAVVLLAGAAANAAILPRAWAPKQDYRGALEYLLDHRQPGDAVAMAGMTRIVYDWYIPAPFTPVTTAAELEALEQRHERTWVVYTVPTYLAADVPEVAARIEALYTEVTRFPGTLGEGAIRIAVRE